MTRTFRRLLALTFLLPILAASPARAQLYNAGDACPEPTPGRLFTQEGAAGPSLVCNGTTLEVDESVLTGPYARGVGTATPKAPLHVAGEAIIGPTTGLACDADRKGGMRWSDADLTFEMCDGTQWKKIMASAGAGTPSTPPVGSGYFILTNGAWDGDLKTAGVGGDGFDGANKLCLSDLTSNDWMGKTDAQTRGILTAAKVRAFLCYGSNDVTHGATHNICQNPLSGTTYVFAVSGQPSLGGATFTASISSQGPQNTQNWSGVNYFGSSSDYWTGRRHVSSTLWSTGGTWHSSACNRNWDGYGGTPSYPSSANYGSSNTADSQRWTLSSKSCALFSKLICMVHP